MHKKILLIQFRTGYLEQNEQEAYAQKLGVDRTAVASINLLHDNPDYPELSTVRAVIICGAGDNSAGKEDNLWFERLAEYVREADEKGVPVLGVCFGHQLLGRMYGGRIVNDETMKELGTVDILLTDEGKRDPIFKGLGDVFASIAGHNDSATDVPSVTLLATNEACPLQAFKVNSPTNTSIYGIQFHPELTEKDFRARVEYYKDYYIKSGENFDEILERGRRPTTDHAVLKNFRDIVYGNEQTQSTAPVFKKLTPDPVSVSPKV